MHHRPVLLPRFLALVATVSMAAGCTSFTSGSSASSKQPVEDRILFSHAEPRVILPSISNTWSTTVWPSASAPSSLEEPDRKSAQTGPTTNERVELTILFANDQHRLSPQGTESLRRFVQSLPTNRPFRLKVTGHTDNNHTADYNTALSQRRAEAVRDWLVQSGVPAPQITTEWQGLHQPAASNQDEEGRARNRRVDIRLHD